MFSFKKKRTKKGNLKLDFWRGDIWAAHHAVECAGYEITSCEESDVENERYSAVVRRRGPLPPVLKVLLNACKNEDFKAGYNVTYW